MDNQDKCGYNFGNVQIFKNKELGHGAYGAVYKAKCDALPCAAKFIYPLLFGSNTSPQEVPESGREHRQPMRRFEAECRFLSQIKHPNIVQYLSMYRDPETNAPVLLMELMDESLTRFLETPHNSILFHVQVNILYDTALALAFLHLNRITHRDLSSNNVLLVAGSRAKVTDFGMHGAAPQFASLTQCPGTPAYMPPEALDEPPVYTEKLDCFSFGVLMVQTITREFPQPADRFQNRELVDPQFPLKKIQARVVVPELERRQTHIGLVPADHPLRSIALDCLNDRDVDRPTAQQICKSLEQVKTTPLYDSSLCQIRDREILLQTQEEIIQDNQKQLQDQQQTIQDQRQAIQDQQETIQRLQKVEQEVLLLRQEVKRAKVQVVRRQNELQLPSTQQHSQVVQQEIQQLRQQVQSSEELVAEFQQGMTDKDRQIQMLQLQIQILELKTEQPEVKLTTASASKKLKLTWRKGPKAPTTMRRGSSTIIGNTVYVNPFDSREIFAFDYGIKQWSTLTQCPYTCSTLMNIENQLTTVGGEDPYSSSRYTNKLISSCDQEWMEIYPPMPTKRIWTAVLSTNTHIVVIGGWSSDGALDTTEILNTESKQWSSAIPLPFGIHSATATLCERGEALYLMGGDTFGSNAQSVLSCRLKELVKQSTLICARRESSSTTTHSNAVWHNLPDLPVCFSTCVTVHGHILAIGGKDKRDNRSSVIYRYDEQRNRWIFVNNKMTIARSSCLATALPDDNILVVGGITDIGRTGETEISTVT